MTRTQVLHPANKVAMRDHALPGTSRTGRQKAERQQYALDDHDYSRTRLGPGLPAAQAPCPVPKLRLELRQGPGVLPGSRRPAVFRLLVTLRRPGEPGARQELQRRLPPGTVRERPALCRLVVPIRSNRAGLRLG